MSEHRRKPPQGRGRRAAQPSPGRRAAPRGADPSAYGSRAEARRAAQGGGGGRRRAAASGMAAGGGGRRAARASEKKRFIDYPRSDRDGLRRWIPSWKQILGACVGFLGLLVAMAGVAYAMVEVPDPNAQAQQEKNVYYWADGKQMVVAGEGEHNRQIVPLTQIPESMQWAVIAAENETFYEDAGVDPMGIVRALGRMAMGGDTQSGSTITQQYVKNTYLDQSQTLSRKFKELFISVKVGAEKDKGEILEGYLNTAYYGRGAYGIQAAAQAYFGKDSKDLDASESAYLASTLNGPNFYDTEGGIGEQATKEKNIKRAEARWSWTLDREVAIGRMTKAERAKYSEFPMPKRPKKSTELKGQIGYMVNLANNYITNDPDSGITKRQLEKGGYKIYTTFDRKKTDHLKAAIEKVKKANIDPKKRKVDKYVQFGGASVKPGDGAIQAIYGGEDATKHFTNNADYTGVQVGSTFKPFVLAAAMRDGVRDPDGTPTQGADSRTPVSPKSVYNGNNKVKLRNYDGSIWRNKEGKEWNQRNDGNQSYGDVDLRTAMKESINTPFIQLGMDVGLDKVRKSALDAGVNEESLPKNPTPTFSLGVSAPSAIRMANAYGTFAKSGVEAEPYSVRKVEKEGEVAFQNRKETTNAFDAAVADNVTDLLRTVVEDGTGSAAQALGRPAAGKTGTTDGNKSSWFTGYTPQLATSIGMWRVNDQAKQQKFLEMYGVGGQKQIHGASFPAEIWTSYMKAALENSPVKQFPTPTPLGDKVYGDGASPTPTATPSTPSEEPSEEPTEEETSETPSHEPSETPSDDESCHPFDPRCKDEGDDGGNEGGGGDDQGQENGGGDSTPPGDDEGQGDGGIFGNNSAAFRRE
ncbi:transglycosylase domain-containing protein [Streptomyces xiaopingdaonensis]|uniref:transglycosylase domain-containing protein n=1 Tax=Streptomyces xiaopingdaonensis TaxID=1565415 RepID=UPI0002DA1A41|nr:transglycosylase domain-containing protein [Streptomyces xiaopingdaonensis]